MNKYRASIATAVLGAASLAHGQSLNRNSFSASLIANGISRFHSVRVPAKQPPIAVVAPKVSVPSKPASQAPPAPKPVVVAVTQTPPVKKPVAQASLPAPALVASHTSPGVKPPLKAAPAKRVLTDEDLEKVVDQVAETISGPMVDPSAIELEMPAPPPALITVDDNLPKGTRNLKLKWVEEGYFDIGYERLIGTFNDQVLRYGVRYGQDDLHVYVRNSTLDTVGTGLPYPQTVTGLSAGIEARHWFPGDKMYAVASIGDGISGYDQGKTDVRYGLAGYTSWSHDRWFGDFYGELFYIALATDTFLDWRLRSGRIWKRFGKNYVWGYVVGQFWVSGQTESGTENRMESGIGVGYVMGEAISLNIELRAGYAFRSGIDDGGDRLYWNPTIILAGGFYKGYP